MSRYDKNIHVDFSETKELMELLKRHGFYTDKSLGQHFLISQKALNAIVNETLTDDNLPVLEIGPGIGVVTRQLLEQDATVTAIEIDKRAIKILGETVGDFDNVKVIESDILKLKLDSVLTGDKKWVIVGNLPYYITTPVITKIIAESKKIEKAIFMVQKEVADRLTAAPDNKTYGSLTVFCDLYAESKIVARVQKGAFMPPPNVDSAVISMTMRENLILAEKYIPAFERIIRAAFQQRRKQITNCLMANLNFTREVAEKLLEKAEINKTSRAENLSTQDYANLSVVVFDFERDKK